MKSGLPAFITGATFDLSGVVVVVDNGVRILNLTGWTARSQIRTEDGDLIVELSVVFLNAAASLIRAYTNSSTINWPVGIARMDIVFTSPSGAIVSTGINEFTIKKGITV